MKLIVIPVTAFQQNCSILWCEETMKGAVIDPGGEIDNILQEAEARHIEIEKILVTHGHADHCGGVAALRERLGVPVEGPHEDDRFWIDRVAEDSAQYGLEATTSFEPDRWLHDGDEVTVGNIALQVIHCPGHTPGHVVFFSAAEKVAVVGDVLFAGSIGRTDFPRGNHADLISSIRNKLFPLGDDIAFLPGHGPASSFGREREGNPFVGDGATGAP
ncbi:MAG: MBL fold metallo-hydrolase [Alphaproteobacteria bacterium]|nr:MBL fold metallo-hydrolase [Alphaproteobacteria bacterium]